MIDEGWGSLRKTAPRSHAKPFLKWAGGKGQLLKPLLQHLPRLGEGGTYFEPFLGAGAVFFAVQPPRAVLSDINHPLIETYQVVKGDVQSLITVLSDLPPRPRPAAYYALREEFNSLLERAGKLSKEERVREAALFIWLNHTCFNGLYRVNQLGLFNVPLGSAHKPFIFDETSLRASSRALRLTSAKLEAVDYKEALKTARRGDVVYLDPPYDPLSATARFTNYTRLGFDNVDQRALAETVRDLKRRGCGVLLTNSATEVTRELYSDFEVHSVDARRAINCVGSGRGSVKELLVIG